MKFVFASYDAYEGQTTGVYPPVHLCNIATALKAAGFEAKVFDYCGPLSKIDNYLSQIAGLKPDVVGLTSYTPFLPDFHKVTKSLRDRLGGAAMVVGGSHPTAWPEWSLKKMPQFDFAMQGECDRSIVAFAEMLSGKRSKESVPGLVYRRGSEICMNKKDFIEDLDGLPQLDRRFLDRYYKERMYWDMAASGAVDIMITSRGCPYGCTFCFKVEKRFRLRSADHVMREFEDLKSRGTKSIHIQDDAFTANKKRCMEIAEALIRGKYNFELKIRSRVDSVDEELLKALKAAGVRRIIYGFESGSQDMLDVMDKGVTVEANKRAVDLTKKAGIACYGEIMIGMPGETSETIDQTIAFLLEKKPIIGFVAVLYPLPCTEVYEEAKKNGTLVGDWTTDGPMPWVRLPWAGSRADIERQAARIARRVQRDPGTIWYFLKNHIGTLGPRQIKFLLRVAIGHL